MNFSEQFKHRQCLPVISTKASARGLQVKHLLPSELATRGGSKSSWISSLASLPTVLEDQIYSTSLGTDSTDRCSSDTDNIGSVRQLSERDGSTAEAESPNQEEDGGNDPSCNAPIRGSGTFVHRNNFGFSRLRCQDNTPQAVTVECTEPCESSEPDESLLQDRQEMESSRAPTTPLGRSSPHFRRGRWQVRLRTQDRCCQEALPGEVPSLPSSAAKRLLALRGPTTA
eukprot:gnl/TRDRNA2_/TRDRNA2_177017_c0_seq6.p1 gnl/TRDRNA2_/TRDRNA2_177017_c0~~gnl/TRDRNA2_/TRDRNA2_177017_c0_seq6.p1  ORF type:complete len:228 (-),score=18.80 gnl/TRDRNA2_/TRDRNA2_177017_c0_seq6:389-1072(-)